jgi:DHA1 family tetracycline resistance protein-like MFS transporter
MTTISDNDSIDIKSFLGAFHSSKGAKEICLIGIFLAFSVGSLVSLIPDVISDRYARINHDYTGEHCSIFDRVDKPIECQEGSDDAQEAATWSKVGLCALALFLSPVVGSISDSRGRKRPIIFVTFLASLLPASFLFLVLYPRGNPVWFYVSDSVSGAINIMSLMFAALSDVIPERFRAASFGLLMAGFYGGFCIAPSIPLFLSHFYTTVAGLLLSIMALVIAVFFLPETLATATITTTITTNDDSTEDDNTDSTDNTNVDNVNRNVAWGSLMLQPLRDISILNRHWTIRLVALGSFVAAMVYASDATFFIYYVEEQLNAREEDISTLLLAMGIAGVILQGACLQPLITYFGEKRLLVITFISGALHNFLYGMAQTKEAMIWPLLLSQLTKLNFPILASLASKDASADEQGRIQGALFAIQSIASAVGPVSMEYVYNKTENEQPGFMFVYAAFLYALGVVVVSFIPHKSPQQHGVAERLATDNELEEALLSDLEEPLLRDDTVQS